jgi:hypothetical protein
LQRFLVGKLDQKGRIRKGTGKEHLTTGMDHPQVNPGLIFKNGFKPDLDSLPEHISCFV